MLTYKLKTLRVGILKLSALVDAEDVVLSVLQCMLQAFWINQVNVRTGHESFVFAFAGAMNYGVSKPFKI